MLMNKVAAGWTRDCQSLRREWLAQSFSRTEPHGRYRSGPFLGETQKIRKMRELLPILGVASGSTAISVPDCSGPPWPGLVRSSGRNVHLANDLSTWVLALVLPLPVPHTSSQVPKPSPVLREHCVRARIAHGDPRGLLTKLHHVGDERHRAGGSGSAGTTHHGHGVA
jgi:hypothetical protein